jgi:hypothetical protein
MKQFIEVSTRRDGNVLININNIVLIIPEENGSAIFLVDCQIKVYDVTNTYEEIKNLICQAL